jgi:hypothetical protein
MSPSFAQGSGGLVAEALRRLQAARLVEGSGQLSVVSGRPEVNGSNRLPFRLQPGTPGGSVLSPDRTRRSALLALIDSLMPA